MRRKSNAEHLLHGTFRPDRHGKRKKKEPDPVGDDSGCPDADIYVGHVCGRACTTAKPAAKITEADIRAEMAYAERFFGSPLSRKTAIEWLTMRQEILTAAEYRAVTRATFEQRGAGKALAEY